MFGDFAIEMAVGSALGIAGGMALRWLLLHRRPALEIQQPLLALAGILAVYGVATVAHGSGFLAVLIAGIVTSDAVSDEAPTVERFHATLASLGQIVAFVMLGITVPPSHTRRTLRVAHRNRPVCAAHPRPAATGLRATTRRAEGQPARPHSSRGLAQRRGAHPARRTPPSAVECRTPRGSTPSCSSS